MILWAINLVYGVLNYMLKKKAIFILSLGIMLGVFIGVCGSVAADKTNAAAPAETNVLPYEDLRTLLRYLAE